MSMQCINNAAFYSLLTFKFIGKQNFLCHDTTKKSVKIVVIVPKLCETAIHDYLIKILHPSNPVCDLKYV